MSAANHLFSGNGKPPPEKLNFKQTCNRLSIFMKEKGNLRDINFGINAKFDATGVSETPVRIPAETTTVDLLSNMTYPGEKIENNPAQYVILDSSCKVDDSRNKPSSSKALTKPKTAQMTIFYGGNILVLDDVTEEKARDLMLTAQHGPPKIENRFELASTSKPFSDVYRSLQPIELQTKGSDLPIARRASLHKFLAKRKDRATVRAPYQLHNNQSPGGSSSGTEYSFDLNL